MDNKTLQLADDSKHLRPSNEQFVAPIGYNNHAGDNDNDDDEIDLRELFSVIMRRKGTIILIAMLTFVAAFVVTLMTKPVYRASTTLQIDPQVAKVVSYDVEADGGGVSNTKDFYQTQFEVIKSRALAKRTIERMGLESTFRDVTLTKPFFSEALDNVKLLFIGENQATEEEVNDDFDSRIGQAPIENRLISKLSISPVKNSQIVKLSYDDGDPQLAADIVNSIAANYIEMNLERRIESTGSAKEFLSAQLIDVKSRLEKSQAELNQYLKDKGLFKIGGEQSPGLIETRIVQLSTALGAAETRRIETESKYKQAVRAAGSTRVLDSSSIQGLKKNLVEFEAKYQEQLQIYKPGYPLMVQLRRQIQQVKNDIIIETRAIEETVNESLRSEYLAAKENEAELSKELELQKRQLVEVRDKDIGYNTLFREVETNKSSYDGLLTRLKEVNVAGGIESNNISVLDPAIVPFTKHTPNTKLNLALGGVLGLFLGMVVAFLLEFLDDRVKSTDELDRLLGMPLLGMTPSVKGHDPIVHAMMTANEPTSAVAEAFRSLRTNLLFASKDGTPKVLVLTSAMPAEGKSSSCLNLATAFAQSGSRVLIIDADLRKPTLHKRLKLDNSVGLSNFLTSQAKVSEAIQESNISGIWAITAGPLSPNPSELLSSSRLEGLFTLAPDPFDLIIVDAPPVMGLADALILSNRASATVMVTAFSQSKKRQIQDAHRRLRQANANLIGVLFTKVKAGGGYGGYDYYDSYYTYGDAQLDHKV